VGNPEQRMTSTAAAARSIGRTAGGLATGGSIGSGAGSSTRKFYRVGTCSVVVEASFTERGAPLPMRTSLPGVAST